MLSLYPISLTHNKQLERYNEMARSKTYRWKGTNSKKGDLFGFYFYGKFIRIHEIIDCQDLLILTQQLIEISWEEWVYLNGPRVTKTKQYDLINYPLLESKLSKICKIFKSIEPIRNTFEVSFKEPLLEIPCAKIMKRFINNLNKEVEYDGTLWQIIYCLTNYGNVSAIWKRREKLLLNLGYYQNNSDIYPGNILKDFRIIAEKYGKWSEYTKEKFEYNNNKITKYDGIKKEYKFLDSKSLKWHYYENTKLM